VTLDKLERGPIVEYATLLGAVRWPQRALLKSEITGPVTAAPLREGDRFKAGDMLVTVDVRDYEIRVAQAQADLLRAEKQLAHAKLGTREEVIARIAAEAPEIEARLALARSELARTEVLFKEEVRTQSDLDMARATYAQTQAQLVAHRARLEEAKAPPRVEDIAVAEANVAAAEVAVRAAQRDVDKARIVAPYDGVVIAKSVELGGYVRAGDTLLEIVATDHLEVIVEAPETLMGAMARGVEFRATADALPAVPLTCTIVAVIPEADPQTRNFRLRATVVGGEGLLMAGMFIRATVPVAANDDALLAPLDAVTLQGTRQVVWVARPSEDPQNPGLQAFPVPVTLGLTSGDRVEISGDGLAAGDVVITTGGELLQPGGAVMEPPTGGPPGGPPGAAPPAEDDGEESPEAGD
jgi:multidrug efflux pump subunit AcrA (membrane-fusion protein)